MSASTVVLDGHIGHSTKQMAKFKKVSHGKTQNGVS